MHRPTASLSQTDVFTYQYVFVDVPQSFTDVPADTNGGLLRDLWPASLGRSAADTTTLNDLQQWQIMPATFDDLCDWAEVDVDPTAPKVLGAGGPRTAFALLWSPTVRPDAVGNRRHRVLLRLHGLLAAFCIQPLGNWKG